MITWRTADKERESEKHKTHRGGERDAPGCHRVDGVWCFLEQKLVDSEIDGRHVLETSHTTEREDEQRAAAPKPGAERIRPADEPQRSPAKEQSDRRVRLHGDGAGQQTLEKFDLKSPPAQDGEADHDRDQRRATSEDEFGLDQNGSSGHSLVMRAGERLFRTRLWEQVGYRAQRYYSLRARPRAG